MATNTIPTKQNHTAANNASGNTSGPYAISFDYLLESDVEVRVNNTLKTQTTHYTFPTKNSIQFTSGNFPSIGNVIQIKRNTNITVPKVDFQDGSVLNESDLDNNSKHILFGMQETKEDTESLVNTFTGSTAPTGISNGARWYDTVSGRTFVYYVDADSAQWVESNPPFDFGQSSTISNSNISATAGIEGSKLQASSGSNSGTMSAADFTKLSGIETGATRDQTDAEIRTAVEAATDSNVFTDADHSKLNAIEANADVTDATNVDAAGAVMNSDTSTSSMNFVIDEDNMSSNSATKVPTQQSVKAYVDTEVADLVNSAPSTLDTLGEIATALNNDAALNTTLTNSIATKLPLAGGTLTGDVTFTGDSADIVFDKSDNALEFADNAKLVFGDGGDLTIVHDSNHSSIKNITGNFSILSDTILLKNAANSESFIRCQNSGVELYHANSLKLTTYSGGFNLTGKLNVSGDIDIPDNSKLLIGTGDDIKIFHNSTDSFIENTAGNLHIRPKASEEGIKLTPDGAVELYHDNVKKAETASNGLDVEGTVTCDDILLANSIQHEGQTNTKIEFDGTQIKLFSNAVQRLNISQFAAFLQTGYKLSFLSVSGESPYIRSFGTNNGDIEIGQGTESMAQFKRDGAVELYHNGTKKFETTSTGVSVTGDIVLNGSDLDIYTSNGALIANDSDGASSTARSGSNIDHIWHDDTNDSWNLVSDSTYKSKGNTNINVGSINGNSFTTFKYHGAAGDGTTDDSTAVTNALATGKRVNGDGLIYKVSAVPTDFKNIRNAAFKVDKQIHPSKDFFNQNTAKITNNRAYTAWAQDKSYVVNNQIKVWSNFGDAHKDGVRRPICFISDDGGNSYPETTLLEDPKFEKLESMSAGTDGIYEYVFASKAAHTIDINDANIGSVTHYMYRRPVAVKRVQKVIATSAVSTANETITITNHGYGTGLEVKYNDEGGTAIGGLSDTHYFVIRVDANTIKLASSLTNAEAGTAINLTGTGNNSQTITPYAGTYQRWKRTTITLPVSPYGSPAIKPIFQHSFAAGNGYIVTGATNGSGSFLVWSTDEGATWTAKGLISGGNYEEPTVRYDSTTSSFYAFSRGGNSDGQIAYHIIPHALNSSTVTTHIAPSSFWTPDTRVQDSPVPFVIKDGYIHAFCTLRGTNADERPDSFYIKHQLSDGANIWTYAELYNIGQLLQLEKGDHDGTGGQNGVPAGASGVGIGSALIYNDKIMFFYSSEERSQADEDPDQDLGVDKIVNLYQFVLNDKVKYGVTNYVDNFVEDRSSTNIAKLIPDTTPDNRNRQSWWQSHGNFIFSKTRSFSDPHINSRTLDTSSFSHETGSQLAAFDSYDTSGEVSIFGETPNNNEKFGFTVYNTDDGGATGFMVQHDQSLDILCDGSSKATVNTSGQIKIPDNGKLLFGAGDGTNGDLEIYHDGSHTYLDCPSGAGNGDLIIKADDFHVKASNNEFMIEANENAGVHLYHNNSEKCKTTEYGFSVNNNILSWNEGSSGTNDNIDHIWHSDSANAFYFISDGTEKSTTGSSKLVAGAIVFAANDPGTAANRLDDYEEGTHTPGFANLNNSSHVSVTYFHYTKVGRLVHVDVLFNCNASLNDGSGFGFSLPFTQAGSRSGVMAGVTDAGVSVAAVLDPNASTTYIKLIDANTHVNYTTFAGHELRITGTYEAA